MNYYLISDIGVNSEQFVDYFTCRIDVLLNCNKGILGNQGMKQTLHRAPILAFQAVDNA